MKQKEKKQMIKEITDYILLNAFSVDSSGLYNGKAGLSLALFQVSRVFGSREIEDYAFDLLQESLLTKCKGIMFEKGLSGIGYVLLYLLNNKYIEGDFFDLFADNHMKIIDGIKIIEKVSDIEALSYLSLVYYLHGLEAVKENGENVKNINKILNRVESWLNKNFSTLESKVSETSKTDVLFIFSKYLKTINDCDAKVSLPILEKYAKLYKDNVFSSNIFIGVYLYNIGGKFNSSFRNMGMEHCQHAKKSLYYESLSLSQKIDIAFISRRNGNILDNFYKNVEKDIFSFNMQMLEDNILLEMDTSSNLIAGYKTGLSRLISYYAYTMENPINRQYFQFL